jgi:hypothetical protein
MVIALPCSPLFRSNGIHQYPNKNKMMSLPSWNGGRKIPSADKMIWPMTMEPMTTHPTLLPGAPVLCAEAALTASNSQSTIGRFSNQRAYAYLCIPNPLALRASPAPLLLTRNTIVVSVHMNIGAIAQEEPCLRTRRHLGTIGSAITPEAWIAGSGHDGIEGLDHKSAHRLPVRRPRGSDRTAWRGAVVAAVVAVGRRRATAPVRIAIGGRARRSARRRWCRRGAGYESCGWR